MTKLRSYLGKIKSRGGKFKCAVAMVPPKFKAHFLLAKVKTFHVLQVWVLAIKEQHMKNMNIRKVIMLRWMGYSTFKDQVKN